MADCTICKAQGVTCRRKEGFMGFGETRTATIEMDDGRTREFSSLAPILECEVINGIMSPEKAAKFLKSSRLDFGKFTQFP